MPPRKLMRMDRSFRSETAFISLSVVPFQRLAYRPRFTKTKSAMHSNSNTKSARLAASMLSSVAAQFISLLAPLIVMPALLNYLGDEAFGVWAAAVAITGVMAFMDLGIGNGLLSRIADAAGRHDDAAVRRYVACGYMVLGSIAFAGLGVLLIASLTGIGEHVVSAKMWPIVVAVLSMFLIGIPALIIYRVLQSLLRIPLQSVLQVAGAAASVIACLTAIHFSAPAWVIVLVYGGSPVLVMLLAGLWFFASNREIRPRFEDISIKSARNLAGVGSYFFVLSILTAIGTNADILIISHLAGPAEVAGFVPPMKLGSVMLAIIPPLFMPLWSFHAQALARGDVEWVRRTTVFMSMAGVLVVTACGLLITAFSETIMTLWMHRTFEHQDAVLLAMTAASAVMAFTSPYNMVLNSQGRAREQILPWLIFVVATIALKVLLISGDTTWLAPAITSICYLVLVTPMMIFRARQVMASSALQNEN